MALAPAKALPRSWGSSETPRTATGLLEEYVEAAQGMERIAYHRRTGSEPLEGEEAKIVSQVERMSIGLQRIFRRWCEIRIQKDTGRS